MAPVLWGLDLAELQWGKFKSSYMWNQDYHLRRTKFIVYQLAMTLCVVSESLGTAALSDFLDQQDFIQGHFSPGSEYNNDFVGAASYNIFVGIYVAFIFGGAFFFDLIWPLRRENKGVRLAWRICSIMASVFVFADVIMMTVIVTTHRAHVTGLSAEDAVQALKHTKHWNLIYKKNGRALASLVFLWVGAPFVFISTAIMWLSHRHDEQFGPHSKRGRKSIQADLGDVAYGESIGLQPGRNLGSQPNVVAGGSSVTSLDRPTTREPTTSLQPELQTQSVG